jgi:hypothetical protein
MKDNKLMTVETTNQIARELLGENAQIVFLPAGCRDLNDSNYERYLDCRVPESSICLVSGRRAGIAIGDGFYWLPLMVTNGSLLRFTSEARSAVPSKMELILREQFEQLAGSPTENCVIEFVEWLYSKRPTSMRATLRHLLSKPNRWLIGPPPDSQSIHLFSEPPVDVPENDSIIWYELRSLQMCEPCLNDCTCTAQAIALSGKENMEL